MTINLRDRKDFYRTSDLALAATLGVSGFVIEDVEKTCSLRSVFVIKKPIELDMDETIRRYWRGEMKVEPQSYFNQLKILKTRIYQR